MWFFYRNEKQTTAYRIGYQPSMFYTNLDNEQRKNKKEEEAERYLPSTDIDFVYDNLFNYTDLLHLMKRPNE